MNYLAIDTSGKNLTVIAKNGDREKIYFDVNCGVDHSTEVMIKIEEVAKETGLDLSKVDFFACVVGAGSFTGIRIGISTVKALCFAYNKPCLSITSFDCMAYNRKDGKFMAVIDAGHNGYYVCGYENLKVVLSPRYVSGEELKELSVGFTLIDSDSEDIANGFKMAIESKSDAINKDYNMLAPLYLRKSQAEEGRP